MPGTASATASVVWFYLKNLNAIYLYIHLLTITKGMYLLVSVCVYVCVCVCVCVCVDILGRVKEVGSNKRCRFLKVVRSHRKAHWNS